MNCEHIFNQEVTCIEEKGHSGHHSCYKKEGNSSIKIIFWNDQGETPINPEEQVGLFEIDYDEGVLARQKIMNLAIREGKKILPEGTVFEIRAKILPVATNADYGENPITRREMAKNWSLVWYYVPKVKQPPGFEELSDYSTPTTPLFENEVDSGQYNAAGGYILLARLRV